MANTSVQSDWLAQLDTSHKRILASIQEGKIGREALVSLADFEAFCALNLDPMPINPVAHLREGYTKTRPYLAHLTRHDPARIVPVGLRDGGIYPMTPRKILRRVLDHTLDHFDQIDQWIAWQNHGTMPTPRDGWAPAAVSFNEDTFPLAEEELAAWLWRIDRAITLLIHRAAGLTQAQLQWQPPDGWTLHRMLHHVARWYGYAAWLDEELPENPILRYREAHQRLRGQLARFLDAPPPPDTSFYGNSGIEFSLAEAIGDVLAAEEEVHATGALAPGPSEV